MCEYGWGWRIEREGVEGSVSRSPLIYLCVMRAPNHIQGDGVVGILTHGVIDRAQYYSHALVLALIPFHHREMY